MIETAAHKLFFQKIKKFDKDAYSIKKSNTSKVIVFEILEFFEILKFPDPPPLLLVHKPLNLMNR